MILGDVENRVAKSAFNENIGAGEIFLSGVGEIRGGFGGRDLAHCGVNRFRYENIVGVFGADFRKQRDGVGFGANADRVDHADELRAGQLFRGFGKRGVDGFERHRFERETRVEVELFVRQHGDERGNRVFGSDNGKPFARDVFDEDILGRVARFLNRFNKDRFVVGRNERLQVLRVSGRGGKERGDGEREKRRRE